MWKTFAGRCIYQSESARVLQNALFRWLQFNSKALQTLISRYTPHRPQLNYIKSFILPLQQTPKNCCMLGLGGGGTAHALSPILGDSKLTIVEYSAEVIDLSRRYFMMDTLKNLDIIHDEASAYISRCTDRFDHLLVDLYTAHEFPAQCANADFFSQCKARLRPGGVIAVNLANVREHYSIFTLIQAQFQRATAVLPLSDSSNIIVFAQNNESIDPLLDALQEAKKLKQVAWSSKWGYILRD